MHQRHKDGHWLGERGKNFQVSNMSMIPTLVRESEIWGAAIQRCSLKELPKACNFIKKETLAQLFTCEFREIFKNIFFYRTCLVAASNIWRGEININYILMVEEVNFDAAANKVFLWNIWPLVRETYFHSRSLSKVLIMATLQHPLPWILTGNKAITVAIAEYSA